MVVSWLTSSGDWSYIEEMYSSNVHLMTAFIFGNAVVNIFGLSMTHYLYNILCDDGNYDCYNRTYMQKA